MRMKSYALMAALARGARGLRSGRDTNADSARRRRSAAEEVTASDSRTLVIRWRRSYPQAGALQASGRLSEFPALPRPVGSSQRRLFAAHN